MGKIEKTDMPRMLPVKRKRMTVLRAELEALEIGEGYFLPREDWKAKNPPYSIVRDIRKKTGRQFEYGFKTDGSCWLFRRVGVKSETETFAFAPIQVD